MSSKLDSIPQDIKDALMTAVQAVDSNDGVDEIHTLADVYLVHQRKDWESRDMWVVMFAVGYIIAEYYGKEGCETHLFDYIHEKREDNPVFGVSKKELDHIGSMGADLVLAWRSQFTPNLDPDDYDATVTDLR